MLDPQREIQALVDNFVAEVGELAKRLAIAQLRSAFGEPAEARPAKARGAASRGEPAEARPAKARAGARAAASLPLPFPVSSGPSPQPTSSSEPGERRGRTRRAQGELEVLRDKLLAAVAERPGRRTEELNAALGTRTPEIAQLLRGLVSEGRVRTEGARRGTRYFLGVDPAMRRSAEPRATDAPG